MLNSNIKQELNIDLTPETQNTADSSMATLPRSKDQYLVAYDNFMLWKSNKNAKSFSEDVFLAYFDELAKKHKPSTLWSIYCMLKSTVRLKNGVNINTYSKLKPFLKSSNRFSIRKSKVLSSNDIEKFLKEAPDQKYLVTKVVLIFGITGSCTRQEICNMTTKDIEHHGKLLLVTVTSSRTKRPRSFTIHGPFYDIVKKYQDLRTPNAKNDRFFQNYQKGKCTTQPIGINKVGSVPKEVARFLKLRDADSYTGHNFRRTSFDWKTGLKLDILKFNGHIGSVPNTEKVSNVEDSIQNETDESNKSETEDLIQNETEDWIQIKIEDLIQDETEDSTQNNTKINTQTTHSIDTEPPENKSCPKSTPITSTSYYNVNLPSPNDEDTHIFENCTPPTSGQDPISETINNNLTQTVRMPTKRIVYTFENCTFTNCFKK